MTQIRKALVAFLIPNVPALLAFVTARWGVGVAAEATAIASALGVYQAKNEKPSPLITAPAK